jgi:hypothetical protein
MPANAIRVVGARVHNLKNITVEIPRDKLVVITGLSGSGKSSLAFDTIFAEGQRRYVESLSAYARQFLGQMVEKCRHRCIGGKVSGRGSLRLEQLGRYAGFCNCHTASPPDDSHRLSFKAKKITPPVVIPVPSS